jgi:hypothetical protein
MSGLLQACRSIHGWLGVFVMPWVVIIGATGFYLNHGRIFTPLFEQNHFSESQLEQIEPPTPVTREVARLLGEKLWSEDPIKKISRKSYHGRPSYFVKKAQGNIIISIPTGHYYLKTRYTRRTYSRGGEMLHAKIYWKRLLKDIHETGWLGGGLGTWLADTVAIAMMVFGFTGIFMWSAPKVQRLRRRIKVSPENKRSESHIGQNPSRQSNFHLD